MWTAGGVPQGSFFGSPLLHNALPGLNRFWLRKLMKDVVGRISWAWCKHQMLILTPYWCDYTHNSQLLPYNRRQFVVFTVSMRKRSILVAMTWDSGYLHRNTAWQYIFFLIKKNKEIDFRGIVNYNLNLYLHLPTQWKMRLLIKTWPQHLFWAFYTNMLKQIWCLMLV